MARLSRSASLAALAFGLVILCGGSAAAQMVGGGIQGTVKDAQGALLPGASVVVQKHRDRRGVRADHRPGGHFQVPALPPGEYEVHIALTGFRPLVNRGIRLAVGQVAVVDTSLGVGGSPKRSRCAATPWRST